MRNLDKNNQIGKQLILFTAFAFISCSAFAQESANPADVAAKIDEPAAVIDLTPQSAAPVAAPEVAAVPAPATVATPEAAAATTPAPAATPVPAPAPRVTQQQESVETRPVLRKGVTQAMEVALFKSGVIALDEPAARISVGNPDIADILILRSTQLYVLGKDLGSTNVILWDRNDRLIGTVAVEVTHDLESLKQKLHQLLPDEDILIYSSQRNIVLAGRVTNLMSMDAALLIAKGYLAPVGTAVDSIQFEQEATGEGQDENQGDVVNLMEIGGGQQVMLEVKVAEISRTELRSIEAKMNFISDSSRWTFGGANGGATFPDAGIGPVPGFDGAAPFGPAIDLFSPNDLAIDDKGLFASYLSDDFLFNMALNASKSNGLARILAEPTLTTLTGQEAEFLSGGEFPIPVPQDLGRTTIEYKDFGVGLRFLPVVLDDGIINLKVNISVTELAQGNSVVVGGGVGVASNFFVPSLTKRSATATYELRDGQTIGVAGLISENLREVVEKFPGLGDLPILGALFRSQSFIKGETELMILITPRLAKPIDPNKLTLPTDSFVEPSDADFYLLGRMEGSSSQSTNSEQGGTDSEFGHQVQ
jgi:pilus assembly protein CpaC